MTEFILAHSTRGVNLVSKDEERHLGKVLDGKECIKFGLGLRESLKVGTVDEEDNTVDFGEVVPPETPGCERV
jgi:hypothetical protein